MVINIKKIILFISLFLLFNTSRVDSNSEKFLLYDKNNLYEEKFYTIYFDKINSNKLESIIEKLNFNVLGYIIDDKKYYAYNIDDLVDKYTKDMDLRDRVYYLNKGILIDGITLRSDNRKIIELEKYTYIY